MEEFYLAELGFPPRIKKKSRKPKGIDQGPMKRKSREGKLTTLRHCLLERSANINKLTLSNVSY